jgi:2-polyprenyl-3-methyl-5-hydroxy-6-metoxy-1,4-benzoquinol methylase
MTAGQPSYRRALYRRYLDSDGPGLAVAALDELPRGLTDFLDAVVRRHFPPAQSGAILDLGCGCGLLVDRARRAGYSAITGVDAAPTQVALAARLGIDGIAEGEAMATLAGYGDGSLEAVVAFDMLEHLTKDEIPPFVAAIHRVLRPGGRWIIHTVNAESPFSGRVRYGDFTHEVAFTQTSLAQILRAAGFSEIDCFEDAPVPRRPAAMLRWLAWRAVRGVMMVALAAETGHAARRAILSQNMLAVAIR